MSLPTEELTCQELAELITAYLEDELPVSDHVRFEAHLAECPYCRTYLHQMGQTLGFLGRLTERELAPEVKRELLQRFRDWKTESR